MCLCNDDCSSDVCFVNPTSGMRICYDPASPPTSSDGGTFNPSPGVGKCDYSNICDPPSTACPANLKTDAPAGCFDFNTDANNCGGCGKVCTTGACCGGKCVDTTSDDKNCGGCSQICCPTTAGSCTNSVCTTSATCSGATPLCEGSTCVAADGG